MAIKKGVKKKEGENLTSAHIEKVISLLEAEKPITKKEACEILNISYNTTRLGKIISEYKDEKEHEAKRRAANRGKPATPFEIQTVIEGYLDGDSTADIAKRLFRPTAFVKKVIEDVGVPEKVESYFKPALLPEKCISEDFSEGQIVWSARDGAMAIVRKRFPAKSANNKQDYDCYRVWVIETIEEPSPYFPQYQDYGGHYSVYAWYDLGSMEHLKEFGVDVYRPYRNTFTNWLAGR